MNVFVVHCPLLITVIQFIHLQNTHIHWRISDGCWWWTHPRKCIRSFFSGIIFRSNCSNKKRLLHCLIVFCCRLVIASCHLLSQCRFHYLVKIFDDHDDDDDVDSDCWFIFAPCDCCLVRMWYSTHDNDYFIVKISSACHLTDECYLHLP